MAAMGPCGGQQLPTAPPADFDMEKRYVGVIKSFNTAKGIGFVECAEVTQQFGNDVFLHASQILNNEEVGDVIQFTVQLGKLGQPRAKDIMAIGSVQEPEVSSEANKEPSKVYTGTVKSFNAEKGFGFIVCADTYPQFGSDVFLHKDQASGISIGDTVRFTLKLSTKGQPQAQSVEKAEAAARGGEPLAGFGGALPASAMPEGLPMAVAGSPAEAAEPQLQVPFAKAPGGLASGMAPMYATSSTPLAPAWGPLFVGSGAKLPTVVPPPQAPGAMDMPAFRPMTVMPPGARPGPY